MHPQQHFEALKSKSDQTAAALHALQKELHDGLSQQVAGVALMASRLVLNAQKAGGLQTERVEQLTAAIEDTKRQVFALAERLKQIEHDLRG